MSRYRAAILSGPRGPFAIVEMPADPQLQLTPEHRQRVVDCLRKKRRNLPVVFVTASAGTLHAMHGFDVSDDIQRCLEAAPLEPLPWMQFDHNRPVAGG